MKIQDYNEYIYNYFKKDNTKSAIMLNAPWGTGKSYYIREFLIPYINDVFQSNDTLTRHKRKNKNNVILISLYGIKSLEDISKSIYLEYRFGKIKKKRKEYSETIKIIGKTIIKGVASHFKINLNTMSENDLNKLVDSLNLKNKLIIFEDLERSNIPIKEVLGYINNLVEQDEVKVLVVANEEEIVDLKEEKENSKKEYFKIKEKTISDTINFKCDIKYAIKQIMEKFIESRSDENFDGSIDEIESFMCDKKYFNLRAFIYACQKTNDIFNKINDVISWSFKRSIFLSIVIFSINLKKNSNVKWESDLSGLKLGNHKYPLLKCVYNYIINQEMNIEDFKREDRNFIENSAFMKKEKELAKNLNILYSFYVQDEQVLLKALNNIKNNLLIINNIPISQYLKLANYLIASKEALKTTRIIKDCKEQMISNLKQKTFSKEDLPNLLTIDSGIELNSNQKEEFDVFYKKMKNAIYDNIQKIDNYNYEISEFSSFINALKKDENIYIKNGSFMKYIDIDNLTNVLTNISSKEIYDFRQTMKIIYSSINIDEVIVKDKEFLLKLKSNLDEKINEGMYKDSVARLQLQWLSDNLLDIVNGNW